MKIKKNLRNLIPLLEDPLQRQTIIDALLQQLQSEQSKLRKKRKELVPIDNSPPSHPPDPLLHKTVTEQDGGLSETAA